MKRPKLKKASKRLTCRKRYMIEKKIRVHRRKVRKEAKRKGVKKRRKDPGVPNSAPFKEEILRTAEERKRKLEEGKQQRKDARRKEVKRQRLNKKKLSEEHKLNTQNKPLQSEQHKVLPGQDAVQHSAKQVQKSKEQHKVLPCQNTSQYRVKELQKALMVADVVIEILDARDPAGCRCPDLEATVLEGSNPRPLLLLLNKIDLAPRASVQQWLNVLKKELPVLAYKSSTTHLKLGKRKNIVCTEMPMSPPLGAGTLHKILSGFVAGQSKGDIRVAFFGFPNVGKSSVVNSLMQKPVCASSPKPGITRCVQEVTLDKQLLLLDTPAIIAAHTSPLVSRALHSLNLPELEFDPVSQVEAIFPSFNKEELMLYYTLPTFANSNEFLQLLGQRWSQFVRAGQLDYKSTARSVLVKWLGVLPYYTQPPTVIAELQTTCPAWARPELNPERLDNANAALLKRLQASCRTIPILMTSPGPTHGMLTVEDVSDGKASECQSIQQVHSIVKASEDEETYDCDEEEDEAEKDLWEDCEELDEDVDKDVCEEDKSDDGQVEASEDTEKVLKERCLKDADIKGVLQSSASNDDSYDFSRDFYL
uniref:guanine nucleotide-binding protein-like 3 isoform X2 n=1 Tax=Myxine glutinosa TaxID=7769 RepID=UPI00358F36AA